jgi:hypothetical protein
MLKKRAAQKRITRHEAFLIVDMIRANSVIADHVVTYNTGWGDDRVLAECGATRAHINHVMKLRNEELGVLPERTGDPRLRRLEAGRRLDALEARIVAQDATIAAAMELRGEQEKAIGELRRRLTPSGSDRLYSSTTMPGVPPRAGIGGASPTFQPAKAAPQTHRVNGAVPHG